MSIINRNCILGYLFSILIIAPLVSNASVIQDGNGKPIKPAPKGIGHMMVPSGKGWAVEANNRASNAANISVPQHGIHYHGGPVMGATLATVPKLYFIWYGNWTSTSASVKLINFWAQHVSGTPYNKINSTYTNANGAPILNQIKYSTAFVKDPYSQGVNLSDASVFNIVKRAIGLKLHPLDANGIYVVITSPEVIETSGFCTKYCGWHVYGRINNVNIKYAFVGDPITQCPTSCMAQQTSPNGLPDADAMISSIAHEVEEVVTDPLITGWYNNTTGEENADKCAWTFGITSTASNGSRYNMIINNKKFLIQRNWVNKLLNGRNGYCAKAL